MTLSFKRHPVLRHFSAFGLSPFGQPSGGFDLALRRWLRIDMAKPHLPKPSLPSVDQGMSWTDTFRHDAVTSFLKREQT